MIKRLTVLIIGIFLMISLYGCVALVAGAAGGVGTATWLSGKLTQEVNANLQRSLKATRSAFESLSLDITKETVKDDVAQIIGKYTNGKTVWVDLRPVTASSTKIEIRVGAVADTEAASKILDRVTRYL
jgi:hypothetical protein